MCGFRWEASAVLCLEYSAQLYLTLCHTIDYSPPVSSVHGIFQTRTLKWVAITSSRGSSWLRDWSCVSCVSCIGRQALYHWATWEAPVLHVILAKRWSRDTDKAKQRDPGLYHYVVPWVLGSLGSLPAFVPSSYSCLLFMVFWSYGEKLGEWNCFTLARVSTHLWLKHGHNDLKLWLGFSNYRRQCEQRPLKPFCLWFQSCWVPVPNSLAEGSPWGQAVCSLTSAFSVPNPCLEDAW